jgi:hypothetical protein
VELESKEVTNYSYESEATRSNPSLGSGVSPRSRKTMRSGATPSSCRSSRRSMMFSGSVSQEADGYSETSSQLSRNISEITWRERGWPGKEDGYCDNIISISEIYSYLVRRTVENISILYKK